jgi:hypothetical protein
MLAQSPCRRVPLPKVEREEMRFLTPAQVAALADAIDRRYRALVLVGAYGGLRIGELAAHLTGPGDPDALVFTARRVARLGCRRSALGCSDEPSWDALHGTAQPVPTSPVVRLPRRSGRGPSVAPGDPGNDESAADGTPTTL